MAAIRFKRGTRAQLDAAASAGQLALGEPYVITDEDGMAFGLGASSYMDLEAAMRTWASGMTVRKHQSVISPADGEEYRRITATGGGTTDPADDVTNYVARSYVRTVALPAVSQLFPSGGVSGAISTTVGAISTNVRTSVLNITGRGALSYLGFVKDVTGSGSRVEIICDGRNIYNVAGSSAPSSGYLMLVLGSPIADPAVPGITGLVAVESTAPVQFRRSLQVYVTALSAPAASTSKLGYIIRSEG